MHGSRTDDSVLPSLKPLLESGFRLLESSHLLILRLKSIDGDHILQVHVEGITGRHQVLIVNELDEGLHSGFFGSLFGRVLPDDLARVLLDPCN